jgi:methionyl-tRNA formyltransferase
MKNFIKKHFLLKNLWWLLAILIIILPFVPIVNDCLLEKLTFIVTALAFLAGAMAIILQKEAPIGPDDTLGQVYFNHLFPLGIQALLEAADLVAAGKHQEIVQDESQANYEGWFDQAAARIHWSNHINQIYNLIRACNPAPGAWTALNGEKVQIYDVRKHITPSFGSVKGKPGEIIEMSNDSFKVACHGGHIEVLKAKAGKGSKVSGAELSTSLSLQLGQFFDA